MKVISIVNGKGGVGKTASSINIATSLAIEGFKVLLIDLDSQANTTKQFTDQFEENNINDIFSGEKRAKECIRETEIDNLHVIPSSHDFEDVIESILSDMYINNMDRMNSVKELDYDYILCDCPPSLGLVTMNSFVISDFVLVPIKPDKWALEGFAKIMNKITLVQERHNNRLNLLGAFVTMDKPKTIVCREMKEVLKQNLGDKYFTTTIRENTAVAKASFEKQPVILYDRNCKATKDYIALTEEIVART